MSNIDLQQYNSPAGGDFPSTASVNTNADQYLLPTDGPLVTADSNAVLQAPVNVSLKAVRRAIIGLRGATIGDFAGAVQKTVRSWYANLTGGNTHTKPAGTITASGPAAPGVAIEAESGDIQATTGDIIATAGKIRSLVDYIQSVANGFISGDLTIPAYSSLYPGLLRFIGTATTSSNPAGTTAIANQLRAINTPKAWCSFTSDGMAGAGVVIADSCAIASIVKDASKFTITFSTAFDSANYSVARGLDETNIFTNSTIMIRNKAAGSCEVWVYDGVGFKNPNTLSGTQLIDLQFFGRQTT